MARKKQDIKVILHKPETMDPERKKLIDEFWIEMFSKKVREFNLTEEERQFLMCGMSSGHLIK